MYSYSGAVTGTSVTLAFPPGRHLIAEPLVMVVVKGAPTDVDWTLSYELVAGVGEVFTGITLAFQAGAVGQRYSLLLLPQ